MFGMFKNDTSNDTNNSKLKVKVSKKEWNEANRILQKMREQAVKKSGNSDAILGPVKISRKKYGLKHSFELFGNGKLYCLDREYLGTGGYGKVKLAENEQGELKAVKITASEYREKSFEENATRINYKSGASENPSHLRARSENKKGLFKRLKKNKDEVYTAQKNVELMDVKKGRDLFDERGRLSPPAKIITGIRMLLDVQRRFHDLGEIHRDLKPENMMAYISATNPNDVAITIIDPDMSTELTDLGPANPSILETQGEEERKGTLDYMSPEAFNKFYGVATDVFALAKILFSEDDLNLNSNDYPVCSEGMRSDPGNRPQIWEMVNELWNKLTPDIQNAPYMITTKKMVDRLIREKNPSNPQGSKLAARTELRTRMIRFASNLSTQQSSSASDTMLKESLAIAIKQLLINESAELENGNPDSEPPDLKVLIDGYEKAIINTIKMIKSKNGTEPDHLFNILINQLQSEKNGTWQQQLLAQTEVQEQINSLKGEPFNYKFDTNAQMTSPKKPTTTKAIEKPVPVVTAVAPAAMKVTGQAFKFEPLPTGIAPPKSVANNQPHKPHMTAEQRENEIKKELNNAAEVAAESCPLLAQIHQAYHAAKPPTPKEKSSQLILNVHEREQHVNAAKDKEFFNELEKIIMHPAREKTAQAKQVQEVINLCNSKKSVRATEHFIAAYINQEKPLTTTTAAREAWVAKGLNDLTSDATKAFAEPQREQRMSSSSSPH